MRLNVALVAIMAVVATSAPVCSQSDPQGWLNNEALKTPYGTFEFKNGYPAGDSGQRLLDMQKLNRAVDVYTTQMMRVSEIAGREGMRAVGSRTPQQIVIWENLMDSKTVLLTANAETVYGMSHLNLKTDGPTVIEAPPRMLGFIQDGLQRYLADVGPLGPDKGAGGKFLVLPPGYAGSAPDGYFVSRSPTYSVMFAVRGFQVDNKTDQAVALMKQTKIYPLAQALSPPPMQFINGSNQNINAVFPDDIRYFELLAMLVNEEPSELFDPTERSQMRAIGIEKGKAFDPDEKTKALLAEAARVGGAIARANTFGPPPGGYYYPDRKWQGISGESYTFLQDGAPLIDSRNNAYYMAAGNTPAMMEKNVGQGSQYLWTYRDASGEYLDGGKTYKLHVAANIPAGNFWSVVAYDALSRSELQNGQPFPSISTYTQPKINADGSIDVLFGPDQPNETGNWIKTVAGKGWFPIFRFYGPKEAFFDKSWRLNDIVEVRSLGRALQ
jgi:hypothetical protein